MHIIHPKPVFPSGFRCTSRNCGLKPEAADLALFVSDVDAAAAAVSPGTTSRARRSCWAGRRSGVAGSGPWS